MNKLFDLSTRKSERRASDQRGNRQEVNNKGSNLDDSALVDVLLNTASVLASDETDIALLTPAGAPRVTDDPVDSGARLTPADNVDGVVDGSGAAGAVHDAASVRLHLVGIEVDGDDTAVVDGSLDGRDAPCQRC